MKLNTEILNLKHKIEQLETENAFLRENEQSFRKLNLFGPVIKLIIRLKDGIVIETNPYFEKSTGFKAGEILGKSIFNLPIFDKDEFKRLLDEFYKFGNLYSYETYYNHRNGKMHHLLMSAEKIYLNAERCLIAVAMDISEIIRAEKDLARKVFDLEILNQAASVYTGINNFDKLYDFIANTLKEITGCSYLIISNINEYNNYVQIKYLLGTESIIDRVSNILGVDIRDLNFPLHNMHEDIDMYVSRKLLKYEKGIYGLSTRKISETLCKQVEKFLKIDSIFCQGFSWDGKLSGSITLVFIENHKPQNMEMAENLINMAAMVVQRLQTELSLNERDKHLRLLANNVADVIWTANLDLIINYITPSIFNLSGYTYTEMLNNPFSKYLSSQSALIANEKLKHFRGNIQKLMGDNNYSWVDEFEFIKKDGTKVLIENKNTLLPSENGKPYGILGVSRDITNRRKAETALRESEERHRIISELISDYVYCADITNPTKYNFEWIVGAFEKITGYTVTEIQNMPNAYFSIIDANDLKTIQNQFLHLFKGNPIVNEYKIIKKDGSIIWLKDYLKPLYDNKTNKVTKIMGAVMDTTRQKIYESELIKEKEKALESDKLKSAFLANMSHEIRTPMNGIMGFAELLTKPNINEEKRTKFLEIILNRSRDLLNIIDEIIDISKIEAGQLKLYYDVCAIDNLLDEIYTFFSTRKEYIVKENIQLIKDSKIPLGLRIITDELRIKQILINLIENAYKFTHKGEIIFGCEIINDNEIKFFVSDTGIGISPESQAIIFERFRQADDSTTRKYGGTGLGLSISKGFVDLMCGKIWVESESKKGAKFIFTIPLKHAGIIENTNNINVVSKNYNWSNYHILIVEDDEISTAFFAEILSTTNVKTTFAHNGIEAINKIKQNTDINLVLMDIQLPEMNGYEATMQIKALRPKLPIIAQTAFALTEDRKKCLQAGCNDIVTKPLQVNLLFEMVNSYLCAVPLYTLKPK